MMSRYMREDGRNECILLCSLLAGWLAWGMCPVAALADSPPHLAPLEVEVAPEYVLGFPAHLAVTLEADGPDSVLRGLPYADFLSAAGAFGLELRQAETMVSRVAPNPVVDPDLGHATFVLHLNEKRRILIDISEFLPPSLLPGNYEATVLYGPPPVATSRPVRLHFRQPSPEEQLELAAARPAVVRAGTWGLWTVLQPKNPAELAPPAGKADPLRFNRVLRLLYFGPAPDPDLLQFWDGVYLPDAAALAAEIAQFRGETAKFEQDIAQLPRLHPGTDWLVERLTLGQGRIAFYRGRQ
jgi:hypothetical protein